MATQEASFASSGDESTIQPDYPRVRAQLAVLNEANGHVLSDIVEQPSSLVSLAGDEGADQAEDAKPSHVLENHNSDPELVEARPFFESQLDGEDLSLPPPSYRRFFPLHPFVVKSLSASEASTNDSQPQPRSFPLDPPNPLDETHTPSQVVSTQKPSWKTIGPSSPLSAEPNIGPSVPYIPTQSSGEPDMDDAFDQLESSSMAKNLEEVEQRDREPEDDPKDDDELPNVPTPDNTQSPPFLHRTANVLRAPVERAHTSPLKLGLHAHAFLTAGSALTLSGRDRGHTGKNASPSKKEFKRTRSAAEPRSSSTNATEGESFGQSFQLKGRRAWEKIASTDRLSFGETVRSKERVGASSSTSKKVVSPVTAVPQAGDIFTESILTPEDMANEDGSGATAPMASGQIMHRGTSGMDGSDDQLELGRMTPHVTGSNADDDDEDGHQQSILFTPPPNLRCSQSGRQDEGCSEQLEETETSERSRSSPEPDAEPSPGLLESRSQPSPSLQAAEVRNIPNAPPRFGGFLSSGNLDGLDDALSLSGSAHDFGEEEAPQSQPPIMATQRATFIDSQPEPSPCEDVPVPASHGRLIDLNGIASATSTATANPRVGARRQLGRAIPRPEDTQPPLPRSAKARSAPDAEHSKLADIPAPHTAPILQSSSQIEATQLDDPVQSPTSLAEGTSVLATQSSFVDSRPPIAQSKDVSPARRLSPIRSSPHHALLKSPTKPPSPAHPPTLSSPVRPAQTHVNGRGDQPDVFGLQPTFVDRSLPDPPPNKMPTPNKYGRVRRKSAKARALAESDGESSSPEPVDSDDHTFQPNKVRVKSKNYQSRRAPASPPEEDEPTPATSARRSTRAGKRRIISSPTYQADEPGPSKTNGSISGEDRDRLTPTKSSSSEPDDTEDNTYRPLSKRKQAAKRRIMSSAILEDDIDMAAPVDDIGHPAEDDDMTADPNGDGVNEAAPAPKISRSAMIKARKGASEPPKASSRAAEKKRKSVDRDDSEKSDSSTEPDDPADNSYRPVIKATVLASSRKRTRNDRSRASSTTTVEAVAKRLKPNARAPKSKLKANDDNASEAEKAHSRGQPATPSTVDGDVVMSGENEIGDRVLAFYQRSYYVGTIMALEDGKYRIGFDDGGRGTVNAERMRALDLRVGDKVKATNKKPSDQLLTVIKDWDGESSSVAVDLDDKQFLLPLKNLVISGNVISRDFNERKYLVDDKIRAFSSNGFAGKAFLVTSSTNAPKLLDEISRKVKKYGGNVVSDWTELFDLGAEGFGSTLKGTEAPFLLVNGEEAVKGKFYACLAAGIPCLAIEFINDAIERNLDWKSFLVTAGHADWLNRRLSQLVDPNWGGHQWDPSTARNVRQIFTGRSFLFLKPKSNEGNNSEIKTLVPFCLSALGAASLQQVNKAEAVAADITKYDYAITIGVLPDRLKHWAKTGKVGNFVWLKQCIISGSAIPPSIM